MLEVLGNLLLQFIALRTAGRPGRPTINHDPAINAAAEGEQFLQSDRVRWMRSSGHRLKKWVHARVLMDDAWLHQRNEQGNPFDVRESSRELFFLEARAFDARDQVPLQTPPRVARE